MSFDGVLGHERARAALGRVLAAGRVPHAILLHGPEGVGKRLLAERFAASLLCEAPRPASGEACGGCTACRKAAHGNHPDLFVVTRLPKKERAVEADDPAEAAEADAGGAEGDFKAFITVDQVRDLARHASFAPREAPRRVFVVDPADRMNAESQNALLKTLEEPPGGAVLLLVSARPHALLATVRSRCFQLGLAALPAEVLAEGLVGRGMDAAEARLRAAIAEGRPGRAIGLDLEALGRRRDALLDALCALSGSRRSWGDLGEHAAGLVGDDEREFHEGIDLVAALARDALRAASGHPAILHADARPKVERLGRALGAERAAEILELAERIRGDLRVNVNKTLAAESLLAAFAAAAPPA